MTHHAPIAAAGCGRARGRAGAVRPRAQDWPSRPVRILVGTAAGGSPDIVSRLLGDKLAERLGQSFVIENNTQAAGIVAEQLANKAPPDGHTAIMLTAGYAGRAALHQGLAFDPLDGFAFATGVCGYPMVYRGGAEIADQVVRGHAGARQGQAQRAHLYHQCAGLDPSPADRVGQHGGRRDHDADPLSRLGARAHRRARRPRRRDGRAPRPRPSRASAPAACACWRCRRRTAIR